MANTGSPNLTVIIPGCNLQSVFGFALQAAINATGILVAFVFFAKWKGPFLNGPIAPVIVLVPSGAINNEVPSLITDSASSRLLIASFNFLRLMEMAL